MKPRKSLKTFLAMMILCAVCLAGCGMEHYVVGRSYINKTHGFSLQCPTDKAWFMELDGDMVKVRNNALSAGYMGCQAIKDSGFTKVEDFTENFLNEEFKRFSTPSNTKKHKMQVAGLPAYAVEFSGSFDYTPMQNILICILGGTKAYVFTFVVPVLKYKGYRKSFIEFVQSLKVGAF